MTIDFANKADHPRLLEVWESAVKNTHSFLSACDFEFYKSRMPIYFDHLQLYAYKDERGKITGFLGMSGSKVEVLFVDNLFQGNGIGTKLIDFAINKLKADKLDVNEQNEAAIAFYKRSGFVVAGRSEVDGEGKKYPILHMERAIK